MIEIAKLAEVQELKASEVSGFHEIKPETEIKPNDAKQFWESNFADFQEHDVGYYTTYDDRLKCTPKENSDLGTWDGDRGESDFTPNGDTDDGKRALDKLSENNLSSIEYKNAEPDFSKCAEATVEIDDMTENRFDYLDDDGNYRRGNFSQADIKCAEKWNAEAKNEKTDWTARDVYEWRHSNNYSWHECCDTKTMHLVPREIHEQCKHSGGVAECKARDGMNFGGEFDE